MPILQGSQVGKPAPCLGKDSKEKKKAASLSINCDEGSLLF